MQSPFLLVPEGNGIFKTYTLILPGIKKDRMAAVVHKKIIKKYKNPLTTQNNHDTIQDG